MSTNNLPSVKCSICGKQTHAAYHSCGGSPSLPSEIIELEHPRLTKEEIIRQLQNYGCPKNIIESLQEWALGCYLDNLKLGKWNKSQE